MFFRLDVLVFVCALGDFPASFASVLRQIARYLPHRGNKTDSKTHPKSSHDKFKTVSKNTDAWPKNFLFSPKNLCFAVWFLGIISKHESFKHLELGVSGLGTGCFKHLELGVSSTWNWVFQALELGVSGFETGCSRL